MAGITLDLAALATAAIESGELVKIAEGIAAEVEPHYPTVKVEVTKTGVSVTTYGSFDHFKEWGSINNAPLGYMRRAAAAVGNYTPEGK